MTAWPLRNSHVKLKMAMEAGIKGTGKGLPDYPCYFTPPPPPPSRPRVSSCIYSPSAPPPMLQLVASQPIPPLFYTPRQTGGPCFRQARRVTFIQARGGFESQASAVLSNTLLCARLAKAADLHICVPWDLIQGYESNDLQVLIRQILEVVLLLSRHGHRLLAILHHQSMHAQASLTGQVCYSRSVQLAMKIQWHSLQSTPLTMTGDFAQFRSRHVPGKTRQ